MNEFNVMPFAIACEEYTSVCIDPAGNTWVYGDFPQKEDYAYFLSVNCLKDVQNPEKLESDSPLTWSLDEQAIQALVVPGTFAGTYVFNIAQWLDNENGSWEYWWAENGELKKSIGSERRCLPLSAAGIGDLEVVLHPNPVDEGVFSIESSAKILSIEAYSLEGQEVNIQVENRSEYKALVTNQDSENIILVSVETEAGKVTKKLIHE